MLEFSTFKVEEVEVDGLENLNEKLKFNRRSS